MQSEGTALTGKTVGMIESVDALRNEATNLTLKFDAPGREARGQNSSQCEKPRHTPPLRAHFEQETELSAIAQNCRSTSTSASVQSFLADSLFQNQSIAGGKEDLPFLKRQGRGCINEQNGTSPGLSPPAGPVVRCAT
jgi:hypothetical protein